MTSVAFDTLKFANRLKTAGVPAAHAEAEAEALAEVLEINLQGLAESESKNGKALARLEADMKEGFAQVDKRFAQVDTRFAEIKGEMLLLKWMLGVLVAGVAALIIKAFF
ncbi:DUF1640 domain-containing protein [Xylella fastidiosa subsp. sandyi]|uniref:DUF1640 domain-containing protein n=1 Tax=Xylella fastidiosa TaxID=2371 RepID=UPI00292FA5F0|nr:DUF1640 domain-containing protein [Xylella fastidiosa]WNY18122.1 DUF1640 domain-containing protein [Xylella fastidiosa]WNY20409.1 DUF1640 domain-containing protein [Xylella fastidiosa]